MQKLIYPGKTVDLNVLEGDYKGLYRTRIEDVNKDSITVLSAYDKNTVVSLRIDTEVEVIYYDKLSAYAFNARIVDRVSSPIYAYILSLLSKMKKVQRRRYFRVPVIYPVTVSRILPNGLSKPISGTTIDLSGGGMLIQLNQPLEVGAKISAEFDLPDLKIKTAARVVRTCKDQEKNTYLLGIEFRDLSEPQRDKIIRCVFDIQRTLLRKGLM